MKRIKGIFSIILSLFILTGCTAKAVDDGGLPVPLENFNTELRESKELVQAANIESEKVGTIAQVPTAQPPGEQAKTTPKPENSAKKVVAQTPKKSVPSAKPKISSTVQKVEIPIVPPATE